MFPVLKSDLSADEKNREESRRLTVRKDEYATCFDSSFSNPWTRAGAWTGVARSRLEVTHLPIESRRGHVTQALTSPSTVALTARPESHTRWQLQSN